MVTPQVLLACCSVLALTVAAADVDVTVLSGPSPKTVAVISANQIFARESVHAGLSCALICIYLAGLSLPLWRAHALEAILQVDAGPTLSTGTGGTLVQIVGTGRTLPARRTLALEACGDLVACTTAGTGTGNAGVLGYVAVLAGVSLRTGAVVLVWLGVHAGSSVDTRLVAAAVIQIFIAQQATPVPLAVALPGGVAGPVDASRIEHTLITELAPPAVATPALPWDRAAAV